MFSLLVATIAQEFTLFLSRAILSGLDLATHVALLLINMLASTALRLFAGH